MPIDLKEPTAASSRRTIVDIAFDWFDYADVVQRIVDWKSKGTRAYICITNPHSVMLCRRDEQMKQATENAALVLPDGIGIILAARILGCPHRGRVTGPNLMLHACSEGRAPSLRHYFYGGAAGVPEALADRLTTRFPGLEVAGVYSPPFRPLSAEDDAAIVEMINAARPDILWVGLGAPKQEKWMADHAARIQATAMIGVGAAFDFHSGNVAWAPSWVRACGMEWLYRLVENPRRMWWRNLDSFRFLHRVVWQRLTKS